LKLKLKAKLLGSFGIVLIMMLAVAYLGISLGSHMNEDIIDLGNKQVVKVELVGDLNTNLQNIRRYQLQVIVKGQMGDLKNSTGYAQKIEEMIVESEQWNAELGSLMQTDAGKKAHQEFIDSWTVFMEVNKNLVAMADQGKYPEALPYYFDEKKDFDEAVAHLDGLTKIIDEYVHGKVTEAQAEYQKSNYQMIAVTVAAAVVSIILGLVLSLSIIKVVRTMVDMLKDMAESGGDLTKRVNVAVKDEIGELAGWFNAFLDNLHNIMAQVKHSSETVSAAANETSMGNQDLSQRTEEQASSLEEVSSTIEEISASLQKSSDNSSDADKISRTTLNSVRSSEKVVGEMRDAMGDITKGSHEIAEIIAKVNDIAFQTNLLALNAAVEAARAGEQGRGFAVVAAEVRNLAGRTAESAKEIEGLIKDSIVRVDKGNELMDGVSDVLTEIVKNTEQTSEVIIEIASSTKEQAAAAEDIRTAIEQLNQVTQQNASLVEEIAGSSEAVSNEAEELATLVGKFKLNDTTANTNKKTVNFATSTGKKNQARPQVRQISAEKMVAAASEQPFNEDDFEKF